MKCKKVSFADEKNAKLYIEKLKKTSDRQRKPVNAYLCPKCHNWHLTSIENNINKILIFKINKLQTKLAFLQNENNQLKQKVDNIDKWLSEIEHTN